MQVELIDTNSLGHSDQLDNILQSNFVSHPSTGSDGKTFVWPTGACDFRPNRLCSSSVLYGTGALEYTSNTSTVTDIANTITDPFLHSPLRASSQQNMSGYHVLDTSIPQVLVPFSDSTRPDLSPTNCHLFHPQPSNSFFDWSSQAPRMAMPDASNSDAAPISTDDFIEPDMYCRSMVLPLSDGEISDIVETDACVTTNGARQPDDITRPTARLVQLNGNDVLAQHHIICERSLEPCCSNGDNFSPSRASIYQGCQLHSGNGADHNRTTCSFSFTTSGDGALFPSHPFLNCDTDTGNTNVTPDAAISTYALPSDSSDTSPLCSPVLSSSSSSTSYSCIHRPLDSSPQLTSDRSVLPSPYKPKSAEHLSNPHIPAKNTVVTASREDLTPMQPLMMLSTNELASGGSLTCTVVNILKGLRLLNRCGLEDLCASLYGLRNIESKVVANQIAGLEQSASFAFSPNFSANCTSRNPFPGGESLVIRSSSFTSAALVSPRRSTIPRDYSQSGDVSTDPAALYSRRSAELPESNCLVNYILGCSRVGSSLFCAADALGGNMSRMLPTRPNSGSSSYGIDSLTLAPRQFPPPYLPSGDWRRGCASNLVNLLTLTPTAVPKSSRTAVSRLVTGRFLMGPHEWRSVWPYSITTEELNGHRETRNPSGELIDWISTWIRHGVVIVLAQLVPPVWSTSRDDRLETCASAELIWCHRVIYGVSQKNEIYLSNPVELVPVDDVLRELSRKTTLSLSKSYLTGLWEEHLRYTTTPAYSPGSVADNATAHETTIEESTTSLHSDVEAETREYQDEAMSIDPSRMHPHQSCIGDFSLLACQTDPRWNQMNVLGQVLQTLRGLEGVVGPVRATQSSSLPEQATHFRRERSSLSSSIVIPCTQSPGFSLFVPKNDWALVHALFYAPPSPVHLSHYFC